MSEQRSPRDELNAFVDGELELTKQLELEARLADDAALRAQVDDLRNLRAALRGAADYHTAPPELRSRLMPSAAATPAAPLPARSTRWRAWFTWRPMVPAGVLAGLIAWTLLGADVGRSGSDERLMQEVIASHARATLGERLVDVASSDQHTVKPWLSARLDYSPPVAAATVPGASFLGGRVDYLDGRPVAALVYRQRQHVIDAYVWPGAPADTALRTLSRRGFNTVHWARGGMNFWVVSDINRDELVGFARATERADTAR